MESRPSIIVKEGWKEGMKKGSKQLDVSVCRNQLGVGNSLYLYTLPLVARTLSPQLYRQAEPSNDESYYWMDLDSLVKPMLQGRR
jgi:hypothetical protein